MKPGDLVIHKPTNKRLTVTSTNGGNGLVLCSWLEKNAKDEPIECSQAFDWQELRYPTGEEKAVKESAGVVAQRAEAAASSPAGGDTSAEKAEQQTTKPRHARKMLA